MSRISRLLWFILISLCVTACGFGGGEDEVKIALIDAAHQRPKIGQVYTPIQEFVAAVESEGLVTLDAKGQVQPGLAERWIVTDDGSSYIFRLRNTAWPDGTRTTAPNVRTALLRSIQAQDGTSLGRDLAIIADVRAMAARVIEIRLKSPMPQFLQLLAQSELSPKWKGKGLPLMKISNAGTTMYARAILPEERGLPAAGDWDRLFKMVSITAYPAQEASDIFKSGDLDVVLNGRVQDLGLADLGPLSRGTVRVDPVSGLLGLSVQRRRGVLAGATEREAIAMAIDRVNLTRALNLGDWYVTNRIVPAAANNGSGLHAERWANIGISERRVVASRRIAQWRAETGQPAQISFYAPPGPGSDIIAATLQNDLGQIQVKLVRAKRKKDADIILLDRAARYLHPLWFLNQFHCSVTPFCAPEADKIVKKSLSEADPIARASGLALAEDTILAQNFFIPLGAPVRWSLVRGDVVGFDTAESGKHPLYPFSLRVQ